MNKEFFTTLDLEGNRKAYIDGLDLDVFDTISVFSTNPDDSEACICLSVENEETGEEKVVNAALSGPDFRDVNIDYDWVNGDLVINKVTLDYGGYFDYKFREYDPNRAAWLGESMSEEEARNILEVTPEEFERIKDEAEKMALKLYKKMMENKDYYDDWYPEEEDWKEVDRWDEDDARNNPSNTDDDDWPDPNDLDDRYGPTMWY